MFNDAWKIDRPFYFREGIYSFREDFFLFSLSFVVQIYSSTIHSLTNFLENCVDGFDVESAHQDTCINQEFYVLFVLSVRLQVYDF